MKLFLACLLTVVIETAFFAAVGYRKKSETAVIIAANIVTNLALNLLLLAIPYNMLTVLALELLVLAAEYAAYALAFGRSGRLFLYTMLANLISFFLGGAILRLIP